MKPQTTKLLTLAALVLVSAIGVALTPTPSNFGFGFMLGLIGLELVAFVRRSP